MSAGIQKGKLGKDNLNRMLRFQVNDIPTTREGRSRGGKEGTGGDGV